MRNLVVIWHGTSDQLCELVHAITANCACGSSKAPCMAHAMLIDQRVMDHLAFVKARVESYKVDEWAK